jgi:hypothetical protein
MNILLPAISVICLVAYPLAQADTLSGRVVRLVRGDIGLEPNLGTYLYLRLNGALKNANP